MLTPDDLIGERIDQFRLDEFIAMGAMGLVFKAHDTTLKRTVALKLISKTEDITPAMAGSRNRLITEAQAAARLFHDNIVTVFCYGETQAFQYIAMEYLMGTTLAQVLNKRGLLPVEEALPLFDQILVALEAAGREEIIHRDIKPANIMITEGGRVKVMDFGIAKFGPHTSTATGAILGTPHYMSPEQVRGQKVDIRSDLFALGAMLYEVVTGVRPFEADTLATLVYKILQEEPTPPTLLNERFPKGLEKIIQKALAKDLGERYQNPGEMRRELLALPGEDKLDEELGIVTVMGSRNVEPERSPPSGPATVEPKDRGQSPGPGELEIATVMGSRNVEPERSPPSGPATVEPKDLKQGPGQSENEVQPPSPEKPARLSTPEVAPSPAKIPTRFKGLGVAIVLLAFITIGVLLYVLGRSPKTDSPPAKLKSTATPGRSDTPTRDGTSRPTGQPEPHKPTPLDTGTTEQIGPSAGKDQREVAPQIPTPIEPSSAQAPYEMGRKYLTGDGVKRDYQEALKWYRKAADLGHAGAQNSLGMMYRNGYGVDKNHLEALKWFRKAADQGYALAQSNLGFLYQHGLGVDKNYLEALKWFRMAADQGNSLGQNNLGVMYEYGHGVDKNYLEALKLYRKAADQGYALAQSNLGFLYQHGLGVGKNYLEALKWFRKAADQGHATGQNNLGVMYQHGLGLETNYLEALKWFRKAADQGHATAQNNIGVMYKNGYGVDKNYQEALKWFRMAADQGYALAENSVGVMYQHGLGVETNYQEAMKWYRKASDQGYALAQSNLGFLYQQGLGVQKNYPQALRWYRLAAGQGNAQGQYNLGVMYKNGYGVKRDTHETLNWLQKAAEQGLINAQRNLAMMYEGGVAGKRDRNKAMWWYQKAADQGDRYSIEVLRRLRR